MTNGNAHSSASGSAAHAVHAAHSSAAEADAAPAQQPASVNASLQEYLRTVPVADPLNGQSNVEVDDKGKGNAVGVG